MQPDRKSMNEDDVGQSSGASNGPAFAAPSSSPDRDGKGHTDGASDGRFKCAPPAREPSGQLDLNPIIDEIRGWHRDRCYTMETRKIFDLRLGAELRTRLGWKRDLPKDEAERIKQQAADLMELGEKVVKGKATGVGDPLFARYSGFILATIQSRHLFDELEANATKEMERLAKSLPIWTSWAEGVRGFGARSLAVIVGEAGDLSNYPKKGHLRKRMGLAPIAKDGLVQAASTWRSKGGLSKDDWTGAGYSPMRRSRMYVIGDVLVKVGDKYRQIYLARKDYERASAKASGLIVAPAAKIPAKRKDEFVSDGYIHRRAQRYMEQRLLEDLRQAWRRAIPLMTDESGRNLPVALIERKANDVVSAKATQELPTAQPTKRKRKVTSG